MKNNQDDAVLTHDLELRAARVLCRDGWSCEQINNVLKGTEINPQQFRQMHTQAQELDHLQRAFSAPTKASKSVTEKPEQTETSWSAIDFLNRGPDAAATVLRDNGWSADEVSLVVKEAMFVSFDEPLTTAANRSHGEMAYQSPRRGQLNGPPATMHRYNTLAYPEVGYVIPPSPLQRPRRSRRASLSRDVFVLTCMAAFAFAIVFLVLS